MKKIKAFLFAAVAVVALCAEADTWTDPNTGYTWNYIDGGAKIVPTEWPGRIFECAVDPGPIGSISIPSFLDLHFVSSIGARAFLNCSRMTSVTIPDSITSIDDSAFEGCSGLTYLRIPNSVTRIGNRAFHRCTSLVSVDLPIKFKNNLDSSAFDSSNIKFTYWCSVNFAPNGGRVVSSYPSIVKYGDELSKLPEVKRDGYVFLGWYTAANGGCKISSPIKITYDSTFYAHWTNEPEFSISNGVLTAVKLNYATEVVIPDGVTSIGPQAFLSKTEMKSVIIPNGVTNISWGAFDNCSSLTSVTIPDSMISIGSGAFRDCNQMLFDTKTIPGVKLVDGWVAGFSGSNLNLSGVRGIVYGAFANCKDMKSVVIYDGVSNIPQCAFDGCTGLINVALGSCVTNIGALAFEDCRSLTNLIVPSSVIGIARNAFLGCESLTSVVLPRRFGGADITWGDSFHKRPNVVVTFMDVRPEIYNVSFDANGGFVSMSTISVVGGSSVGALLQTPTRSGYTFAGWWTSLSGGTQILESTKIVGNMKLYAHWNSICYTVKFDANGGNGGITWTVESGATLGELPTPTRNGYVFTGWFTDVYDGTQVFASTIVTEDVKFYAHWWSGVDYIVIFDANGGYGGASRIVSGGSAVGILPTPTRSGFTFTGWFTAASGGTRVSELTEVTGDVRFYAHWQYSVRDPMSAAEFIIESGVLTAVKLNGETSVVIPEGVTSIGGSAFRLCESLTSVTIPNSVTNIGDSAFWACNGLTSVKISDSVMSIGKNAFWSCNGLTSITIGNGVTSIGDFAFRGCSSLTSVTIGKSVTSIGDYAFSGCSSLTSVTIPESVTSIGYGAFKGCSSLTSVTIPDSVTSIWSGAFKGCSGLISVTIPDSVTSVENDAFDGCSSLTSVTIGKSVTSIGDYAFSGCSSLTSVTIPESVTSIGYGAFKGCSGLISVSLPERLSWALDTSVFEGCSNVVVSYRVQKPPEVCMIRLDSNGGTCSTNSIVCNRGAVYGTLPTPVRTGYTFIGWFTSASGGTPVTASTVVVADVTYYAHWKQVIPDPEPTPEPEPVKPELGNGNYDVAGDKLVGVAPETAASVYDGYLYLDNVVMGTIQAKVAKPKKGVGKLTVTIQINGEKKLTLKGELDLNIGEFTATDKKSGRVLILNFGSYGISGTFDKYDIDGARNLFDSKDKSEKATAEEILKPYLGAYSMICDGGILSVTIAKKGKVTIKGTINGNKVSLKAQALIGEDMICIPVIYSKKSVNLAFTIWISITGGNAEIIGLDGNPVIGKAGTLKNGAKFVISGDIGAFIETEDPRTLELLPDNETITVSKSKWLVADGVKPTKVAYKKGEFKFTPNNEELVNSSGLKLSYKSKDGSFKGSFTVYAIVKGKLKKHKATVEGVLIGDTGHGTITIKKIGTWRVTIE